MTPEEMSAIHRAAGAPEPGWSASDFAGLLASPHARLVTTGQCFALGRVVSDEAELMMLATDPEGQRQGRARHALADLERVLAAGGASVMFLEVAADNARAHTLYLAAGYEKVGQRKAYYARKVGPAADALLMRKQLRPA